MVNTTCGLEDFYGKVETTEKDCPSLNEKKDRKAKKECGYKFHGLRCGNSRLRSL